MAREDLSQWIERDDREDYVLISTCKRCGQEIAFQAPNDIDKDLLTLMLWQVMMTHFKEECNRRN